MMVNEVMSSLSAEARQKLNSLQASIKATFTEDYLSVGILTASGHTLVGEQKIDYKELENVIKSI